MTLEAKKKGPYRSEVAICHARKDSQASFVSGNRVYSCVKYRDGDVFLFS
ncbi:MAG: hypothetical protein IPI71_01640 [Methanolinea sp.]|nr:MAG: hypothetical protein IPI71_01640 [Methanolinea sp.]